MIDGDLLFEEIEAAITVCLIIILFGVIAMTAGLMLVKRMMGVGDE